MEFDRELLEEVLRTSLSGGGDFADIFIEQTDSSSVRWESGTLRDIHAGEICGAGIRVITGDSYAYVYRSNPTEAALRSLAAEASRASGEGREVQLRSLEDCTPQLVHRIERDPAAADIAERLEYIRRADTAAREYSAQIQDALITLTDVEQRVTIACSDGTYAADRRVRTRLSVNCIARKGDQMERSGYAPGKAMGFEFFDSFPPEFTALKAAESACLLLDADYPPQGVMPVVLANEFGGVIFHEACGHALESANVAKQASQFHDRMGKRIASAKISASNDATLPNEWGSYHVDDEGVPAERTQLIRRGKLVSFLTDRIGARKLDHPLTGSGRREFYAYPPASRMSNTFIEAGKSTFDQMVSGIDYGLYCRKMGGGSVHPSTGEFNFAVNEAYLIEHGKITRPVKGASLIGKGPDVLKKIEMVGKDLSIGAGMCGSVSGAVPAGVGQPAVLVSQLLVGGRT